MADGRKSCALGLLADQAPVKFPNCADQAEAVPTPNTTTNASSSRSESYTCHAKVLPTEGNEDCQVVYGLSTRRRRSESLQECVPGFWKGVVPVSSDDCLLCSGGSTRRRRAEVCTECAAGYFDNQDIDDCVNITGGFTQRRRATTWTECTGNFYNLGGYHDDCSTCPAGSSIRRRRAAACAECQTGFFDNQTLDINECLFCRGGSTRRRRAEACIECKTGYSIHPADAFCTAVGLLNNNISAVEVCEDSVEACEAYFQPVVVNGTPQATSCESWCGSYGLGCIAQYESQEALGCDKGAADPEPCSQQGLDLVCRCGEPDEKEHSPLRQADDCGVCLGASTRRRRADYCTQCATGFYDLEFACVDKSPQGRSCEEELEQTPGNCDLRRAGTLQDGLCARTCGLCSDPDDCLWCNGGSTRRRRSVICTDCATGFFDELDVDDCDRCYGGFVQRRRATSCTPCDPGSYDHNDSSADACAQCVGGETRRRRAYLCTDCTGGFYDTGDVDSCSRCIPGSTRRRRNTECNPCDAGWMDIGDQDNCNMTCTGFVSCTAGRVVKANASVTSLSSIAPEAYEENLDRCCDKACSAFECPLHKILKSNAEFIRDFTEEACCKPRPAEWTAFANFGKKGMNSKAALESANWTVVADQFNLPMFASSEDYLQFRMSGNRTATLEATIPGPGGCVRVHWGTSCCGLTRVSVGGDELAEKEGQSEEHDINTVAPYQEGQTLKFTGESSSAVLVWDVSFLPAWGGEEVDCEKKAEEATIYSYRRRTRRRRRARRRARRRRTRRRARRRTPPPTRRRARRRAPACWKGEWLCDDTCNIINGSGYDGTPKPRRKRRRTKWCGSNFQDCLQERDWMKACGIQEEKFCTEDCTPEQCSSCRASGNSSELRCSCSQEQDCPEHHVCVAGQCEAYCSGNATATSQVKQAATEPKQPKGLEIEGFEVAPAEKELCEECGIDCIWPGFPEWSDVLCPVSCGRSKKVRTQMKTRLEYKRVCEPTSIAGLGPWVETQLCDAGPCPCEWADWGSWGECSKSCEIGRKTRTRRKSIVENRDYGTCNFWEGVEEYPDWYSSASGWAWHEHAPCGNQSCPVDCVWSEWQPWQACSESCADAQEHHCTNSSCVSGSQVRLRGIAVPAQGGGAACVGPTNQTQNCNQHPCPIDCKWGDWSGDQACSLPCGGGFLRNRRAHATPAMYGGLPCSGPAEQEFPCNMQPCPESCEWTPWAEWSDCTRSCGGGHYERQRGVQKKSWNDDTECDGMGESLELAACNEQACPIDCLWGPWDFWNVDCSHSCNGGIQERFRKKVVEESFGGSCTEYFRDLQACNTQPCALDCQWGPWSVWGECDAPCGGGHALKSRRLKQLPLYGGIACQGNSFETKLCNLFSCTELDDNKGAGLVQSESCQLPDQARMSDSASADCVFDDWLQWGDCSTTCGAGGQRKRVQKARRLQKPQDPSVHCAGERVQIHPCKTQWLCPKECVWSPWGDYGDCSGSCGHGIQVRTRTVLRREEGTGHCPGSPVSQPRACNLHNCPVDCLLAEWQPWGPCSVSCNQRGRGKRTRSRHYARVAMYGGKQCISGVLSEVGDCIMATNCPIDCEWHSWEVWGVCSLTCGAGTRVRTRMRRRQSLFGGADCAGPAAQIGMCPSLACPQHCEWGAWSAFSSCSSSCGGGVQRRSRVVAVVPANGGQPCNVADARQFQGCGRAPCPVDCELSAWTEWTTCPRTCGGARHYRVRTVKTPAADGGHPCLEVRKQTAACNGEPCPGNCRWGSWGEWSECKSGGGQDGQRQWRSRTVELEATNGGIECVGGRYLLRSCRGMNFPVDCEWGQWGQWTVCTKTTAGLMRLRVRPTVLEATFGGRPCQGSINEQMSCADMEVARSCLWHHWGQWSDCSKSCGSGLRTRFRGTTPEDMGGEPCIGPRAETTACGSSICPVDCAWAAWRQWATCSATCGTGFRQRERPLLTVAAYGGAECLEGQFNRQPCGMQPCPVDCQYRPWGEWTPCSRSCGQGTRERSRGVQGASNGGLPCGDILKAVVPCSDQLCPIDGEWTDWGPWSDCSAKCKGERGQYQRSRRRTEPEFGGMAAQGVDKQEALCLAVNRCSTDCKWGQWAEWSPCVAKCNEYGTVVRTRVYQAQALSGGKPCTGAAVETKVCTQDRCPQDCSLMDWSDWEGDCEGVTKRPCGDGTKRRFRSHVKAAGGGGECIDGPEETLEEVACDLGPCPGPCVYEAWADWSACSAKCRGIQSCRRQVIPAAAGGEKCLPGVRERLCNVGPEFCLGSPQAQQTPRGMVELEGAAVKASLLGASQTPAGIILFGNHKSLEVDGQGLGEFGAEDFKVGMSILVSSFPDSSDRVNIFRRAGRKPERHLVEAHINVDKSITMSQKVGAHVLEVVCPGDVVGDWNRWRDLQLRGSPTQMSITVDGRLCRTARFKTGPHVQVVFEAASLRFFDNAYSTAGGDRLQVEAKHIELSSKPNAFEMESEASNNKASGGAQSLLEDASVEDRAARPAAPIVRWVLAAIALVLVLLLGTAFVCRRDLGMEEQP
eukprot:TRINITY_DN10211_c0_g1_i1.p1 TRINITY_DN10211_c0_g1~~TRINITY_DN10211_c0_g1_i1.p1  ORF type:complete len:2676 (-),score=436.46 TRINITY_DN10211_c0_g1_i1:580-8202(-)